MAEKKPDKKPQVNRGGPVNIAGMTFTREQVLEILEIQRYAYATTLAVDIMRARDTHPDLMKDMMEIREKFNSGWVLIPPIRNEPAKPQKTKPEPEGTGSADDGQDDGSDDGGQDQT